MLNIYKIDKMTKKCLLHPWLQSHSRWKWPKSTFLSNQGCETKWPRPNLPFLQQAWKHCSFVHTGFVKEHYLFRLMSDIADSTSVNSLIKKNGFELCEQSLTFGLRLCSHYWAEVTKNFFFALMRPRSDVFGAQIQSCQIRPELLSCVNIYEKFTVVSNSHPH